MAKLKAVMQKRWRSRRMQAFSRIMRPRVGARVLDLGGRPDIWNLIAIPVDVTLLNLESDIATWSDSARSRFSIVVGDACSASMFQDQSFDFVFSNSVIEHLPVSRQIEFAQTVRRLAPAWWIQTPSRCFPLEAHCNLPFWWFYPTATRDWCIRSWERRGRTYLAHQMLTTSMVSLDALHKFFPNSSIYTERVFGIPKSYSIFRRHRVAPAVCDCPPRNLHG
jgi:hypothetical protein